MEKSFEWGERIPIGIFYKEERLTYLDTLPHIKGKSLAKLPVENVNVATIIETMK